MVLARKAQEEQNAAADPFTRRRCAPTLVTKTPQLSNKEELIRGLHQERKAAEAAAVAAAKKKLDEQQRLLSNTNKFTTTTTITKQEPTDKMHSERSYSSMTTTERGSFTSFSEHNDEMFTSHDFELDLNIKLFPE
ncbi:unnamed protein product [Adineta ricciae]|uniref:Uncharacterized protein n=1 Tax=Adineta ricciae TaxID=249248 RepID=A0A815XC95_ADIRI|nr:unnamed protein product [Adineta ricciae]CAF1555826.1 unnamed protein product [Adineta ricciae]